MGVNGYRRRDRGRACCIHREDQARRLAAGYSAPLKRRASTETGDHTRRPPYRVGRYFEREYVSSMDFTKLPSGICMYIVNTNW